MRSLQHMALHAFAHTPNIYSQKYGFLGLGMLLVPLGAPKGGPRTLKLRDLSSLKLLGCSTGSIPNLSLPSLKI